MTPEFIAQTAHDYNLEIWQVQRLANISKDNNDFYLLLEEFIQDRAN